MNNENFIEEIEIATTQDIETETETHRPIKNITTLDKIIKWCIYIFIVLMPLWFLPFTGNILDFNKQVLMVVIMTIALIAWLGKLITQESIRWYKGLSIFLFVIFIVVYGLATIFSVRSYNSLMGFDTHLSRALINVIYFFVFFLILVNYRTENEERKNVEILKFLIIFLASSTIVGLISLLQLLGVYIFPWSFTRLISFNTIGSMTNLGIFLAVVLPLSLGLLFGIKQQKEEKKEKLISVLLKVVLIVSICISLVLIILLNFRNLWIITAISMIMISGFWLAKRHTLRDQNLAWIAIPITILALSLVFLFFRPVLFDLNLPVEVSLTQKAGISIVKEAVSDNPILGMGPETFIYNYSLYKPKAINQTIFWNARFASGASEILSLLSEIGILGLIAFLVFIGVFLIKIVKNLISEGGQDHLAGIKAGLFAGWLALFISWFFSPQNMALIFTFWLFLTFLTILSSDERDVKIINFKTSNKIAVAVSYGFIIIMIAIIGLLYLEGSRFIAETKYKVGLDLVNSEKLDEGIDKIVRATVANPYEDEYYRILAQLFVSQINQSLNNQDLDSQDRANRVQVNISNAINSAVRTTTLDSKNVANWIIRGFVYRSLIALVNGSGEWAIKSYEEALKLEPTNPFIYLEMGRTYTNGADLLRPQAQKDKQVKAQMDDYLNKAVEAYNKAIELKPNYAPAHFEIALVYGQQGKVKEAITRMENSLMLAPRDIGVAFQLGVLYYRNSQFDKAKLAFSRSVSLDSNFSNARYFLGLLFDKEGNKAAAIEQFEKIRELNPDNDLVKQILDNLKAGQPALGSPELIPKQPEEIPIEERQPEEIETQLPSR